MTLIAYGPTSDSEAIVGLDLDAHGNLTISIELELGEETHTLPASAVSADVLALVRPTEERAA